jgi:glucose/mannose-6-phosphate isomerase
VFAVSFSGNTEETLQAFEDANSRGAKVISISTGGLLAQRSAELGVPHIQIKTSEPLVPRAAVAYLLLPVITNLRDMGLISKNDLEDELKDVLETLGDLSAKLRAASPEKDNLAKQTAKKLEGRMPVIYGYRPFGCIAYRWSTQLNENSKVLARYAVLPEMNHNDIVGWMGDSTPDNYSVVILRDPAMESSRMTKRIDLTKDLAFSKAHDLIEIHAAGNSILSKMLSLMYIGDFTSVYLALLRRIDPTPVDIIENLKKLMRD